LEEAAIFVETISATVVAVSVPLRKARTLAKKKSSSIQAIIFKAEYTGNVRQVESKETKFRIELKVLACVIALGATASITPTANASPDATVAAAFAPLDAQGCTEGTENVCITVVGDATGYQVTATGNGFFGHIEFVGPGINSEFKNGPIPPEDNLHWEATGIGRGQVCAIGWKHIERPDGSIDYQEIGPACEKVS